MKIRFFAVAVATSATSIAMAQATSQPGEVFSLSQKILELRARVQMNFEAVNEAYAQLFQNEKDIEEHVKYRLIIPQTEAEKGQKVTLQNLLTKLRTFRGEEDRPSM
jgi:TolA-binding protein